jgi:hypothetical protein
MVVPLPIHTHKNLLFHSRVILSFHHEIRANQHGGPREEKLCSMTYDLFQNLGATKQKVTLSFKLITTRTDLSDMGEQLEKDVLWLFHKEKTWLKRAPNIEVKSILPNANSNNLKSRSHLFKNQNHWRRTQHNTRLNEAFTSIYKLKSIFEWCFWGK